MISLVDDLLDVSHFEAGEKYKIILKKEYISKIIEEVVKAQLNLAREKDIVIDFSPDCLKNVVVKVDKVKIFQVFENIVNNSVKYTKPGGMIYIDCKIEDNGVTYIVKDNGVGIPAHQIGRLFERFFRGENVISTESGTGLGLYIAKYIIEKHNGRIWCESKENIGTTFYIYLPLA